MRESDADAGTIQHEDGNGKRAFSHSAGYLLLGYSPDGPSAILAAADTGLTRRTLLTAFVGPLDDPSPNGEGILTLASKAPQ